MTQALRRVVDHEALSDAGLVACLRRGDRAAFGVVVQRYNQRLYRVARGVLADDAEAEDVVQEAYVRAFSALDGFRGEARLSTWLTRIALNEALDRRRRRRPAVALTEIDSIANRRESAVVALHAAAADLDPERTAARSEIRRLVEAAVDALPDAFRLVFVMRDIEEMSVEDTATQLGIRPETVKTRLHRARRLLRGRLEDTLAATLTGSFPFAGARCLGMTEAVLKRLGI
jgi:RNA polymerase sigma-70 factor (ECF subfamily)